MVPPEVVGYEIVQWIATSGQSSVYEARGAGGKRVALKVYRDEWQARAAIEAELLRHISSEHLAVYLDHGTALTGERYVVTAWVEGRSLEQAHAFRRSVPARTATLLVAQMCEGLGALHRAGWVHLDLKAPNVLLASDGRVVVIDLGLSLRVGSVVGGLVGTPQLCAPETYETRPITPAADVYALGMLLYLLLTSRVPFVEDTPFHDVFRTWTLEQWREAHAHRPVQPLGTDVPSGLGALVAACLSKCPGDRPCDAMGVGATLVDLLAGPLARPACG